MDRDVGEIYVDLGEATARMPPVSSSMTQSKYVKPLRRKHERKARRTLATWSGEVRKAANAGSDLPDDSRPPRHHHRARWEAI